MEDDQRIDGALAKAAALGKAIGAKEGKARAIEGGIEGDIPGGEGARRGVGQNLTQTEIFEIAAGIGLGHGAPRKCSDSF